MKRISHDLPGVTQRIARLCDEFEQKTRETEEVWKDAKATRFFQQHTSEIRPTIASLVGSLAQTIELFEDIAKKVRDPDQF